MRILLFVIFLIISNSLRSIAQLNENDNREMLMFNLQETVKKLIIENGHSNKKNNLIYSITLSSNDKKNKSIYDTFRLHAYSPEIINDSFINFSEFVAFKFEEDYFVNIDNMNDSFSSINHYRGSSFNSTYLISFNYSYATLKYHITSFSGNMIKHNIWDRYYNDKELNVTTIMHYLKIRCYSLLINDIQFESQKNNIYTFDVKLKHEKSGKWRLKFDKNDPNNPSLYVDDELFRGEW